LGLGGRRIGDRRIDLRELSAERIVRSSIGADENFTPGGQTANTACRSSFFDDGPPGNDQPQSGGFSLARHSRPSGLPQAQGNCEAAHFVAQRPCRSDSPRYHQGGSGA
jgi:hypothetical protein